MTEMPIGILLGFGIGIAVAWIIAAIWKARYTASIRKDAVARSQAVTSGKVHEQLVPYLPGFAFHPKDVRFLGSPIDFVVFDGLSDGQLNRVVFLEIKTGRSTLSARERLIREAIQARRVEWREWRLFPSDRATLTGTDG